MEERAKRPGGHGDYCQMRVNCPRCGTESLVPWNRLDGPLHCKTCATWLRMDGSGRLVETASPTQFSLQVRSSFSGWQRVRVFLATHRPLGHMAARGWWGRRHLLALATGLAALTVFAVAFASARRADQPAGAVDAALPTALDARVAVWGEAWLSRDIARLLQLADRSRDRDLRRWLQNHSPPAMTGGSPHFEVKSVARSERYLADVTLNIHWREGPGPERPLVLNQLWHQRDGVWYFWPAL